MLPHITPDLNHFSPINEIFKARELYISDIKITNEYIKLLGLKNPQNKYFIKKFIGLRHKNN